MDASLQMKTTSACRFRTRRARAPLSHNCPFFPLRFMFVAVRYVYRTY